MFELVQVGERSYYVESPAKVGVVRLDAQNAVLIDSGSDKDAAKRVLRLLDANGWRLQAIFNTHYHADHIGGNAYLQQQTGCRIFAPGMDCGLVNYPLLEPSFLYGGNPPPELRHKFLLAQPSEAQPLTPSVLPDGMEVVPLAGHSFEMVGFRTADNVVYLADCLSSEAILEKYHLCFLTDVAAFLQTLEAVKQMDAVCFVPSHAAATPDIAALAQRNIDKVIEIGDTLCALCRQPQPFDELLRQVFIAYSLRMTAQQHALVGSTVKSYLTWLISEHRLVMEIEDNRLLFRSVL